MVRSYIRRNKFPSSSRKIAAARTAVNRARAVLGARSTTITRSLGPPATRGFYGSYSQRGRAELKYRDLGESVKDVTEAGTLYLLNGIANGTNVNTRVGSKITIRSCLINVNYYPRTTGSSSALHGVLVRTMLIWDSQANGTTPAVDEILQTYLHNPGPITSPTPLSPMNLVNRDRFTVLMESRRQIGSYLFSSTPVLTAGAPNNAYMSKYKRINKDTVYGGEGATIGDIKTGALYLLVIADNDDVAYLDYYSRIRYSDL